MHRSTCPATPSPRNLRPLTLATRRAVVLLAALLATSLAFAQEAGDRIEQQMTLEQFKAAGLDQLSTEQLHYLNAWLNSTLVVETTKAAKRAKEKVEDENRGFLNFGSDEPVTGKLQGEFRGFARGREYRLENGQLWRQVDSATLGGVRLDSPQVTIDPAMIGNAWYLKVEGYNTAAKVQRIK